MASRPNTRKQAQPSRDSHWSTLEDARLIEKVKTGQAEYFGELVRKYQDRVYNTCWRICGHLEDARDLTQEAFLRAFDRLDGFRQESGFYTWIFRLAVNLALSHRRSTKRRRTVSLEQVPHAAGTQAEGLARRVDRRNTEDPAQSASEAELYGCLSRALQALDDDYRAVVVLRDMEGFDYAQISEILSIPPGTVRSRLHRARTALRDAIQPRLDSEPRDTVEDAQA